MPYFEESYPDFRFTYKRESYDPGFRDAQLGAIYSAAAHFISRSEPGIVTMPTGSGKTAVLIALAFVLRANRVLVITPSRLVREQIAEEVGTLKTLKKAGVLPDDYAGPKVMSTSKKRVTSLEEWEEMRRYDVVVATVQSISPEYEAIPEPPSDLFDLVLVDEAHHSPARTWQAVLDHFKDSKVLLFTATPFRQDQKEIKGRFIFTYHLRDAFRDKVFGEIDYSPVEPKEGEDSDMAIARATERQFNEDKAKGYRHQVMVRTDSRKKANELLSIYEQSTGLKLKLITGAHSLKYVKSVVKQLAEGDLDGIVCVNMLGEGFNLPSLKIAAIHSPHKSLSVTLQFIGRFARTTGEDLGRATFLAVPSEIEIETEKLFESGAAWQEIIQNLSAVRVEYEHQIRENLQSFTSITSISDLSDLSLYSLEPYYHVKVYRVSDDIDIEQEVRFPRHLQVVYEAISPELNSRVFITREVMKPKWTSDDRLSSIEHSLFIFYYEPDSKLLFLCFSQKSPGVYDEITRSFDGSNPKPLSLARLNKALNDLTDAEFFNVGMRNRITTSRTESYRIIAGPSADKSILKSDSRLFHRGHVFGKARENGSSITIGLSSASKIWSNKVSKLPELVEWCRTLAKRIDSDRIPVTNSGLDHLSPGEEIDALPTNIIAVDWPKDIYTNPVMVQFEGASGAHNKVITPITDCDLVIDSEFSTEEILVLGLRYSDLVYNFTFSFATGRFFEPIAGQEVDVQIITSRKLTPFISYINEEMLVFYTSDLALIEGYTIFRPPQEQLPQLEDWQIETIDWGKQNVDIKEEVKDDPKSKRSIHFFMQSLLGKSNARIVYYDHGSGELADFIVFEEQDGKLKISFYHCKGSGEMNPGHRVGDLYEVAGQAVKSVVKANKAEIFKTIKRRFTEEKGSHTFVKGDLATLKLMLDAVAPASIDYELIAVQPGLQKEKMPDTLQNILASANDYLIRGGFMPLRVVAS